MQINTNHINRLEISDSHKSTKYFLRRKTKKVKNWWGKVLHTIHYSEICDKIYLEYGEGFGLCWSIEDFEKRYLQYYIKNDVVWVKPYVTYWINDNHYNSYFNTYKNALDFVELLKTKNSYVNVAPNIQD